MPQGAKKASKSAGVSATPDPYKVGVARRIKKAFRQYNMNAPDGADIKQKDLGRLVGQILKSPEPITQAAVSGWMNTKKPSIPPNPTLVVIADVLKVDRAWLVLGAAED